MVHAFAESQRGFQDFEQFIFVEGCFQLQTGGIDE